MYLAPIREPYKRRNKYVTHFTDYIFCDGVTVDRRIAGDGCSR
jgi:hypothetical protein